MQGCPGQPTRDRQGQMSWAGGLRGTVPLSVAMSHSITMTWSCCVGPPDPAWLSPIPAVQEGTQEEQEEAPGLTFPSLSQIHEER